MNFWWVNFWWILGGGLGGRHGPDLRVQWHELEQVACRETASHAKVEHARMRAAGTQVGCTTLAYQGSKQVELL